MRLTWLESLESAWQDRQVQGRAPHAICLLGAPGSGKRCAASWLAASHLGLATADQGAVHPLVIPEHADLRWLAVPEDKHSIGIEQIRELVAEFWLTSYEGRGKVAVIAPANVMTANAANSLLKTLEEPPGNALLILVVDRVGRLPATIFSRCQRLNVSLPSVAEGVEWLNRCTPRQDWPMVLRAAGNAPLAALESVEKLPDTEVLERDFTALALQKAEPIQVAARWSKLDPEFVLQWLSREIQDAIRRSYSAPEVQRVIAASDSVQQRIDRRNLFCYLDIINTLRGQPAGSFNVLLTLESLLIDWSDGLKSLPRFQAKTIGGPLVTN